MKKFTLVSIFLLSLTNLKLFTSPVGDAPITLFLLIAPILATTYWTIAIIKLPKLIYPSLFCFSAYILLIAIIYNGSTRWTTVIYSFLYIGAIGFYNLNHKLDKKSLENLCKFILACFFINSSIAWTFNYLGVSTGPLVEIFQIYDDGKSVRPQGFSSEPSYAAFISCMSLYTYLKISKNTTNTKIFWLALTSLMIAMYSSVYGYLLIAICFAHFVSDVKVSLRSRQVKNLILLASLLVLAVTLSQATSFSNDSRLLKILSYVTSGTFNINDFRVLDSSGFMRIGPTLSYASSSELWSLKGLIGYGPGASSYYFGSVFEDAISKNHKGYADSTIGLGFIPAFLYDYGIVGIGLAIYLISRIIGRRNIYAWCFFALLSLNANFNTQLFCFFLVMFMLIKRAETKEVSLKQTSSHPSICDNVQSRT